MVNLNKGEPTVRNLLIKGILSLTCLTLIALPLAAQKGKPGGGGGQSGCANVTTPTLSTSIASPGMNVGVFGKVTNCAGKKRYTVMVSSMSSCELETIVASSVISFSSGEAKLISVSYPIAPNTCTGPMTISLKVMDGGNVIASDSASLMIE